MVKYLTEKIGAKRVIEVSNFRCGSCKYFGKNCKCIDHSKVHFSRSCFSCDEYTAHHPICSAFEPVEIYSALVKEWEELGGFDGWYPLYFEQWLNKKRPYTIGIILTKPTKEGREVTDDIWEVHYDDFIKCNIMREDGIHYRYYRHIERSRKSVIGYTWIEEGEGILKFDDKERK